LVLDDKFRATTWALLCSVFALDTSDSLNFLRVRLVQLRKHFLPSSLSAVSILGCGFCSHLLQHAERITSLDVHTESFRRLGDWRRRGGLGGRGQEWGLWVWLRRLRGSVA